MTAVAVVHPRHDVRLALGAATAWVAAAEMVGGSSARALALAAAAAIVGVGALVGARHGSRIASVLALGSFCVALVLAPLAGRLVVAQRNPLVQLGRERVQATAYLTVTADPRPLAARGLAGSPRAAIAARLSRVEVAGRLIASPGSVLVLGPAALWADVLPGQRVRLDVTIENALPGDLLDATLLAQSDPVLIGRPPWWQRAAGVVRSSLRRASSSLPRDVAGLLPGLVDGDTARLDPVLSERFRVAGLTHLVAVSGTNCAIVVGAVLLVLRRARAGPRTCAVVGALVLVAFVVVARPSPSVLRAALMAAVALFGLASGRERQVLPALAGTVLVLLVWQPQLAVDTGFTMSVLATAALLLIAPGWALALRARHVPAGIAESVAVAAAAHLVTAPVVADISGRVSLVAIPANLLAEPAVPAATVLGFLAAMSAPFNLGVGSAAAWMAGWPCRWLIRVAEYFGGLHGATLPWPAGLGGALALLAVVLALLRAAQHAGPRRVLLVILIVGVLVQIPVRAVMSAWPATGWILVACDVGQGDALVLPAGPHRAVVIDAGPDPVAVDRCLSDLSITDVALLVFSHYHLDHVGGISGVFHARTVDEVVTGPLALPAAGAELVHATLAEHGLGIGLAPVGRAVQIGDVRLDYLAPKAPFRGTRSDPNNSSLIIKATVDGKTIMLPGDAEVEAQQTLLDSGVDLHADVLKIPHHGSAYSDPRFLAAVGARVGVISVGADNDYGLPSPLLLSELARLGLPVERTDRDGDIAVTQRDGQLSVVLRGTRSSSVG